MSPIQSEPLQLDGLRGILPEQLWYQRVRFTTMLLGNTNIGTLGQNVGDWFLVTSFVWHRCYARLQCPRVVVWRGIGRTRRMDGHRGRCRYCRWVIYHWSYSLEMAMVTMAMAPAWDRLQIVIILIKYLDHLLLPMPILIKHV